MKVKKTTALLLLLTMVASVLGGCKKSSSTSGDGVQEITWMFWDDLEATKDQMSLSYKKVIDRFNKTMKVNITVKQSQQIWKNTTQS